MKVAEGFELVQLRAKSLDEPALVELARRAAEICRRGGAKLLVNTDPETARGCGADGIHLTPGASKASARCRERDSP